MFGEHPRDPRKLVSTDTQIAPVIRDVYDELKRWEDMPRRREPVTLDMLRSLKDLATPPECDPHSFEAAFANWAEIGLFTGQRRSEWAQPAHQHNISTPERNFRGEPAGFMTRHGLFCYRNQNSPALEIRLIYELPTKPNHTQRTTLRYLGQRR